MLILGVESSCDETAFAVVENGTRVLSNEIASQIELHARFGGVVPEIASRAHMEACLPLLRKAIADAGVTMDAIDAIAVTQGPGLAGCLLVGIEFAKGLAFSRDKPLVAVHHIAGHAWSPWIGREVNAWGQRVGERAVFEPFLALVVSGGHTSLIRVDNPQAFHVLGETMDDAVGEAYDKVAKLLGLGYPGGPRLDKLADGSLATSYPLPRPMLGGSDRLDFSFSGLKAAVARIVESLPESERRDDATVRRIASSFQQACIDVLIARAQKALKHTRLKRLAVVGGVACNRGLRAALREQLPGITVAIPEPEYCTDNAAMIAGLGFEVLQTRGASGFGINAEPGLALG